MLEFVLKRDIESIALMLNKPLDESTIDYLVYYILTADKTIFENQKSILKEKYKNKTIKKYIYEARKYFKELERKRIKRRKRRKK